MAMPSGAVPSPAARGRETTPATGERIQTLTDGWSAVGAVKKVKGLDIYIPPLTGKPRPAAVYN